jgi:multidrug efflux pump
LTAVPPRLAQPGGAFIRVTLSDKTPPAKVKDLWYQVRKKVGDIRNELPPGITGPDFNDEYGDVYSALYMLTADGLSLAELKARAEDIRQRLLRVPDVNKVDIIGEQPQKIFIEFSHAKLDPSRTIAEALLRRHLERRRD